MNSNEAAREAEGIFLGGYNCAQAVLSSQSEAHGLARDSALRIACAFGSGMSRRQEVCGAVTGGLMLLGLRYGRGAGEEKAKGELAYSKGLEFMASFERMHGTLLCRDLIKCDLRTPDGQAHFKQNDLLHSVCAKCVASAAELASRL